MPLDDGGRDVVVAATGWDSSGASASLTARRPGGSIPARDGRSRRTCGRHGAGSRGGSGIRPRGSHRCIRHPPDLVLFGINIGPNTGHAVLHSDTVGTALTAGTVGLRALAVSISIGSPTHWETAAEIAGLVVEWWLDAPGPTIVKFNVPNSPLSEVTGFERTSPSLGKATSTSPARTSTPSWKQGPMRPPSPTARPATRCCGPRAGGRTVSWPTWVRCAAREDARLS